MSKVDYVNPVAGAHGKVAPGSNQSFRGRFTYTLKHPRTAKDFSEHEKKYRQNFGRLNKLASQINKDESRKNEYNDWEEKGFQSRFRYILSELIKSNPTED